MWRIKSLLRVDKKNRPKYWSEEFGWTIKDNADVYTTQQKESGQVICPREGIWEVIPEV